MRKHAFIIVIAMLTFMSASFISVDYAYSQQTSTFSQGVNWQKTLRVRGLMQDIDPFNETLLYNLTQTPSDEVEARANYVQFELIASNFWIPLRDSIQDAAADGRINVHTVYAPGEGSRNRGLTRRGTQVTYNDLLDTLSVNLLENVYRPNQDFRVIHVGGTRIEDLPGYIDFTLNRRDAPVVNDITRIVQNLELFTMYELEFVLHIDETGFEIYPQSLLFGNAIWNNQNEFDEENPLADFQDLFEQGLGMYIDLTDEQTQAFLIESGVQFSGETNTIPFFDLITLFHYDYKFYSESDNVIQWAAVDFEHDTRNLETTLLNRYNDLTYTYLYGQPPSWWEDSGRGHFINGLFEISDDMRRRYSDDEDENEFDEFDDF